MSSPFIRNVSAAKKRKTVANASALSAIALGVVGVMVGSGVASTAIGVSDGLTWLSDGASGEILQYNPSSKRVEGRYQVGQPGDPMNVAQDNGMVAVRNERTGEVITVDMSTMRASGSRPTGSNSKVFMAKGLMVVFDGLQNTLTRVDPIRGTDVGKPWRPGGAAVADAIADEQGTVWVIGSDGGLRGLTWDDGAEGFAEKRSERVEKAGDDAVLTSHQAGVTVFSPRAGVIAQVGTPNDNYQQSNHLVGVSPAATAGSSDLVPGSLANQGTVVILDRGRLRQVSTGSMGCSRPSTPAAFNNHVYVVCQGEGKVIRLTRDGRSAGPDIPTPGHGDAEPVSDEGRLLLNVHGASEGIEIDRSGAEERFTRQPARGAQPIKVQPREGDKTLSVGRDQARQDLAAPPPGGQNNNSGSSGVQSGMQDYTDRTEVPDNRPAQTEAPAPPPTVPPAPAQPSQPPATTSAPAPTTQAPAPAETSPAQSTPEPSRPATPSSKPSASSSPNPAPSGSVSSSPAPSAPAPSASSSGEPDPSQPATPRPTGSPTASATGSRPTATASGTTEPSSVPTQSNRPTPSRTAAPTGPTPRPSPTPSQQVTPIPTRTSTPKSSPTTTIVKPTPTPAPVQPVRGLKAVAHGSSVTVTWDRTGTADKFRVAVDGRSVEVPGGQSSATLTGLPAGTHEVTVIAFRGVSQSISSTSVTIAGATPPATQTAKPTASPTRTPSSTPTPKPPAAPAAPTGLQGTHVGTSATVSFNPVPGATSYTIYCNRQGETNIGAQTSGKVDCGPGSVGSPVRIGVRADNAAGHSEVVEEWATGS